MQIKDKEDKPPANNTLIAVINQIANSLFESIKVSYNEIDVLETEYQSYAMTSHVSNLFDSSQIVKLGRLQMAGWNADNGKDGNSNLEDNDGWMERLYYFAKDETTTENCSDGSEVENMEVREFEVPVEQLEQHNEEVREALEEAVVNVEECNPEVRNESDNESEEYTVKWSFPPTRVRTVRSYVWKDYFALSQPLLGQSKENYL